MVIKKKENTFAISPHFSLFPNHRTVRIGHSAIPTRVSLSFVQSTLNTSFDFVPAGTAAGHSCLLVYFARTLLITFIFFFFQVLRRREALKGGLIDNLVLFLHPKLSLTLSLSLSLFLLT